MDINPAMPQVLYMDSSLIVVSKPYNLSTTAGPAEDEQDCLVSRLEEDFPGIQPVQPMDFACSGVMVLALTPRSRDALQAQFANQQTEYHYEAIVSGTVPAQNGTAGNPAHTHWQQLEQGDDWTRLALTPLTSHSQFCATLRAMGHPILGESMGANSDAERLHLHARRLSFKHPNTGLSLSFESPCPF